MGQQGAVKIYDLSKLAHDFPLHWAKYSEEFLQFVGGFVYQNPYFEKRQVLTVYGGDDRDEWTESGLYSEIWLEYAKEQFKANPNLHYLVDMAEYLFINCLIADWVVWT